MKILLCSQFYHPSVGGVQKVIRELAENFLKMGHVATVATSFDSRRDFETLNGVTIKQFQISGNNVQGMKGNLKDFHDFVLAGNFDALLVKAAQQWSFDALWPILDKFKGKKIHIPCGYSGLYLNEYRSYYAQMPEVLKKFDSLVYNAEEYRDIQFARKHGLQNLVIIPNGASEQEFGGNPLPNFKEKLGIPQENFVFLSVGSPPYHKGHLEVVTAYAHMKLTFPSTLILDGKYFDYSELKGPFLSNIKSLIKEIIKGFQKKSSTFIKRKAEHINLMPGKSVLFTDFKRDEIIATFFFSDLFVFASHVEYSPLVIYESVAAGLPFLSVPVGNVVEIAQWTEGGQLCQASQNKDGFTKADPKILAQEMQKSANDRSRLRELSTRGREAWQKKFTWFKISQQFEQLMRP